ncbi:MAG: hypothetical protein AAFV45_15050 [Pseudomonadota bacterium]
MSHIEKKAEIIRARERYADALALQALENNPLTDDEVLLAARADAENWSDAEFIAAALMLAGVEDDTPSLAAE